MGDEKTKVVGLFSLLIFQVNRVNTPSFMGLVGLSLAAYDIGELINWKRDELKRDNAVIVIMSQIKPLVEDCFSRKDKLKSEAEVGLKDCKADLVVFCQIRSGLELVLDLLGLQEVDDVKQFDEELYNHINKQKINEPLQEFSRHWMRECMIEHPERHWWWRFTDKLNRGLYNSSQN